MYTSVLLLRIHVNAKTIRLVIIRMIALIMPIINQSFVFISMTDIFYLFGSCMLCFPVNEHLLRVFPKFGY